MKNFQSFVDKFVGESQLGENLLQLKPMSSKGALYKINALKHFNESVIDIHYIVNDLVVEGMKLQNTDKSVFQFADNLRNMIVENENAFNIAFLFESIEKSPRKSEIDERTQNIIESIILEGELKIGASVMTGELSRSKFYYNDLRNIEQRIIESNASKMKDVVTSDFEISTPVSYVFETEQGKIVRVQNDVFLVTESEIIPTQAPSQEFVTISENAKNLKYNKDGQTVLDTALGTLVLEGESLSVIDKEGVINESLNSKESILNEFAFQVNEMGLNESELTKLDAFVVISENSENFKSLENFKVLKNFTTGDIGMIATVGKNVFGSILESQRVFKGSKNFESITEAVNFMNEKIGVDATPIFEGEMKDEKEKEDTKNAKVAEIDESIAKLEATRTKVEEAMKTTTEGSEAHTKYLEMSSQVSEEMTKLKKKKNEVLNFEGEEEEDEEEQMEESKSVSKMKVDMKLVKQALDNFKGLQTTKGDLFDISYFPDFTDDVDKGYMTGLIGKVDPNKVDLGYSKKDNFFRVALFDYKFKLIKSIDEIDTKESDALKFIGESEEEEEEEKTTYMKCKEERDKMVEEGIKMNNLDWGKSTEERNKNLEAYDKLKTDEEREAFKKKLKGINESKGDQEEYQKFFKKMLKKYGVEEPDQLKDEDKKKFYEEVDKGWKSDKEECGVDESRMQDNPFYIELESLKVGTIVKGGVIKSMKAKLKTYTKVGDNKWEREGDGKVFETSNVYVSIGGTNVTIIGKDDKSGTAKIDDTKITYIKEGEDEKEGEEEKNRIKNEPVKEGEESPADKIDSEEEEEEKDEDGGKKDKGDVKVEESNKGQNGVIKFAFDDDENVFYSDGYKTKIQVMDGSFDYRKKAWVEPDFESDDWEYLKKDYAKQLNKQVKGKTFVYDDSILESECDEKEVEESYKAILTKAKNINESIEALLN
ncbi:DNA ligase 1 [Tenacibaculum phage pT24]|uniref:DNA ligase 1 n=1 Tax=Tenacibaculum phage pT24 TaxID=1880590 RepID=A0A1B4XWW4_9CAUD|nr:DNA ligase 1 [Tenacibaculum phage pT24]BAV39295.1 DNA ligase 1 [Tenacibaculum phage pT24]